MTLILLNAKPAELHLVVLVQVINMVLPCISLIYGGCSDVDRPPVSDEEGVERPQKLSKGDEGDRKDSSPVL